VRFQAFSPIKIAYIFSFDFNVSIAFSICSVFVRPAQTSLPLLKRSIVAFVVWLIGIFIMVAGNCSGS